MTVRLVIEGDITRAAVRGWRVAVQGAAVRGEGIVLSINSQGGAVLPALDLYRDLRAAVSAGCGVSAWAEGLCASAATILYAAASRRRCAEGTVFLLHDPETAPQTPSRWTASVHRNQAEHLETVGRTMRQIYVERFGLASGRLNFMMMHEQNFASGEAVRLGLVHEVGARPAWHPAAHDRPRQTRPTRNRPSAPRALTRHHLAVLPHPVTGRPVHVTGENIELWSLLTRKDASRPGLAGDSVRAGNTVILASAARPAHPADDDLQTALFMDLRNSAQRLVAQGVPPKMIAGAACAMAGEMIEAISGPAGSCELFEFWRARFASLPPRPGKGT